MTHLNTAIQTLYHFITSATVDEQLAKPSFYKRLHLVFRSVLRTATKMKKAQDRADLKTDMLSDETWRSRIIYDFGGEPALERWEKAYEKSLNPQPEHEKAHIPRDDTKMRYDNRVAHPRVFYDRVKVDINGQFRLPAFARSQRAPIKAPEERPDFAPKINYTKIDPIDVYPSELRTGRVCPEAKEEHANAMAELRETAEKATELANELMAKGELQRRESEQQVLENAEGNYYPNLNPRHSDVTIGHPEPIP